MQLFLWIAVQNNPVPVISIQIQILHSLTEKKLILFIKENVVINKLQIDIIYMSQFAPTSQSWENSCENHRHYKNFSNFSLEDRIDKT